MEYMLLVLTRRSHSSASFRVQVHFRNPWLLGNWYERLRKTRRMMMRKGKDQSMLVSLSRSILLDTTKLTSWVYIVISTFDLFSIGGKSQS